MSDLLYPQKRRALALGCIVCDEVRSSALGVTVQYSGGYELVQVHKGDCLTRLRLNPPAYLREYPKLLPEPSEE